MPPRLTLRVDLGPKQSVGPGKMRLLDAIAETGSISSAGRTLGMSYRRAWMLIDDLNSSFRRKVVTTTLGGKEGGGAKLTPFGAELLKRYRTIEASATKATRAHVAFLARSLRPNPAAGAAKKTRLSR
ncbi:MAG TPA: winged helix-turn-helix domain-containing protein [Stellaceae bacterium]|jgi:molybdate transport system regulatory protein|nr:winged helix-turn-helix domain-containing protein [Stellaceae bacterium]